MKILLVTRNYPPYAMGGVEVYTHRLAQTLSRRHEVAVFFRHDDPDGAVYAETDERVDGITARRVSCPPPGRWASPAREFRATFASRTIEDGFARFVARFRPDVVHIQQVMALSAGLLSPDRHAGVPAVLTLHDYWFLCHNAKLIWPDGRACRGKAGGTNCVRCAAAAHVPARLIPLLQPGLAPVFACRDRVVKRAALLADHYISPSRFLIDEYVAAGFPPGRLTFLENGIAANSIRRFPWRPSDGPLRITFVGALAWHKGVHLLAEAFGSLPAGTARLHVWGDPAAFPDYAARLEAMLGRSDSARLMGQIANDRVGEVLADCDVLVVPSLWYENSPVVIQEAWAAGVPVIASGHGALAEKVRDGLDGLLFPPGDTDGLRRVLCRLLDEPDLLPRLRQGIRPPLEADEHVERLEEIYDRVVHRHIALSGRGRAD